MNAEDWSSHWVRLPDIGVVPFDATCGKLGCKAAFAEYYTSACASVFSSSSNSDVSADDVSD